MKSERWEAKDESDGSREKRREERERDIEQIGWRTTGNNMLKVI
jgi:hypothetical protein